MAQILLIYSDWGILLLRLVLGLIFLVHGWSKIRDLKANAKGFDSMGFKPGFFWGTIVALVEFFGAIFLILGLYTSIVAILIAINMTVATLWKIKIGQALVSGYELDLILAVSALLLATLAGGTYSLDSYWHIRFF
jgi:putative oxidoreductase